MLNIERKDVEKGLSNLIFEKNVTDLNEFIFKQKVFGKQLDVMYSGTIPPNPAELLGSDYFKKLR